LPYRIRYTYPALSFRSFLFCHCLKF
jgi:hypothetical protein